MQIQRAPYISWVVALNLVLGVNQRCKGGGRGRGAA